MNSLVGFTLSMGLPEQNLQAADAARLRALSYFNHLEYRIIQIGGTRLELWGHNEINERFHFLPDGSLAALIGSPQGKAHWSDLHDHLLNVEQAYQFEIPWDGRVILIHISADGNHWMMWNDWLGSIPVFHMEIGAGGRIASTLEPVTVAAAGFTSEDIFKPGLASLLTNGHFISDWTLFKGMKTVPPDCIAEWTRDGFFSKQVWTVKPSMERWESSWDDLVDEMHDLSYRAVGEVLKTQPKWVLPLSSGLDSRLIAAVGADLGTEFQAYAWGAPNSTDVIFSQRVAKVLGFQWKHISLPKDFLVKYTLQWADMFGSAMHFHGMYQMAFLNAIETDAGAPIVTGFIGDVLSGSSLMNYDTGSSIYKKKWYTHWDESEVELLLKTPINDALLQVADEVKKMASSILGTRFQKILFFEMWSRQRFFTSFQSTLSSYWRGVATPFLNRDYARFCMSLPRAALDNRRLLADVFRRYYGRLAVIPGTYASQPFILTGKYLLKRRIVEHLPTLLRHGPFAGFDDVPLRMDIDSIQSTGKDSLWPIYSTWDRLVEWLDVSQIEAVYQVVMNSAEDIRPLRKLQSIQSLA
jgi:hypothetical protein